MPYMSTLARFTDEVVRNEQFYERATRQLEKTVSLSREAGIGWVSALALATLGWLAMAQHNYDRAKSIHAESLLLFSAFASAVSAVSAVRSV